MMNEENNRQKPFIRPEHLWNSAGMLQQLVIAAILLSVYLTILIIIKRPYVEHPALESWMDALNKLFVSDNIFKDIFRGIIIGLGLVGSITLLDTLVAVLGRQNISAWIHRADHLLPETTVQKRWALTITLTGSALEEILFRGFIFIALMSVWTHWIWAALIISAVFSLLHAGVQGFWSTIWIFIISFVLCLLIASGGSLYVAITAHIMVNLSNLFIVPALFKNKKP